MKRDEKVKLLRVVFIFTSCILITIGIRGLITQPEWIFYVYLGLGVVVFGYIFEPEYFLKDVINFSGKPKSDDTCPDMQHNKLTRLMLFIGTCIISIGAILGNFKDAI